jgi:sporulation protein YlmC with PRC-barrel domain
VVLLLSALLGREVVTEAGTVLGRLRDLTVTVGADHPTVSGLVVRTGRGPMRLLAWRDVGGITEGGPLRVPDSGSSTPAEPDESVPLDPHELRLARDVVDTQVVDLQSYRLSRVSDVYLACRPDGAVEVAAAEVGLGAVLQRMGLGWLGRRLRPVVVDWHDLHLTSRRGHELQLASSAAAFHRLDSQGLAELLTRLSTGHATEVIRALPPRHAAAALHRSHPATGRRLLGALRHDDASRVIAAAHPAHAARLAELHGQQPTAARRRLLRTSGWRRYRPPPAVPGRRGPGRDHR